MRKFGFPLASVGLLLLSITNAQASFGFGPGNPFGPLPNFYLPPGCGLSCPTTTTNTNPLATINLVVPSSSGFLKNTGRKVTLCNQARYLVNTPQYTKVEVRCSVASNGDFNIEIKPYRYNTIVNNTAAGCTIYPNATDFTGTAWQTDWGLAYGSSIDNRLKVGTQVTIKTYPSGILGTANNYTVPTNVPNQMSKLTCTGSCTSLSCSWN